MSGSKRNCEYQKRKNYDTPEKRQTNKKRCNKKRSNVTDSVTKCRHRKHPEVKVKYQKTLYYENITFTQYTIKVCNNALSDRMFKDQKHILTAE